MRVLQRGGELNLLEEAVLPQHDTQLWEEDLQCHISSVLELSGQVHRRHTALPDLALDNESFGESHPDVLERIHNALPSRCWRGNRCQRLAWAAECVKGARSSVDRSANATMPDDPICLSGI